MQQGWKIFPALLCIEDNVQVHFMLDGRIMEQYLRVGVITNSHGIKGEVKVFPTTDDIKDLII